MGERKEGGGKDGEKDREGEKDGGREQKRDRETERRGRKKRERVLYQGVCILLQ